MTTNEPYPFPAGYLQRITALISSVHITAQVYPHSFTADEEAAASIWDATMRKAMVAKRPKQ